MSCTCLQFDMEGIQKICVVCKTIKKTTSTNRPNENLRSKIAVDRPRLQPGM